MAADELGQPMGHSGDEREIVLRSHKHSCRPNAEMLHQTCFFLGPLIQFLGMTLDLKTRNSGKARSKTLIRQASSPPLWAGPAGSLRGLELLIQVSNSGRRTDTAQRDEQREQGTLNPNKALSASLKQCQGSAQVRPG